MTSHKELANHIRNRLKAHKVPARVKMNDFCGKSVITIVTPSYEYRWSAEQAREIAICVQVNRLTGAQGSPIDIDNLTAVLQGTTQQNFEFNGGR